MHYPDWQNNRDFPENYNELSLEERKRIFHERHRSVCIKTQWEDHDDIVISGTKPGLIVLRDTISTVLDSGNDQKTEVFSNGGGGYSLRVRQINPEKGEEGVHSLLSRAEKENRILEEKNLDQQGYASFNWMPWTATAKYIDGRYLVIKNDAIYDVILKNGIFQNTSSDVEICEPDYIVPIHRAVPESCLTKIRSNPADLMGS